MYLGFPFVCLFFWWGGGLSGISDRKILQKTSHLEMGFFIFVQEISDG